LIAFVVGYREELFRDLIKRVADVILTPGSTAAAPDAVQPSISAITPPAGGIAGGDRIVIVGTGFTDMTSVTFGRTAAVANAGTDTHIIATVPPGVAGIVTLAVVTPAGRATRQFTYRE
jgi:hypothetical protein